jgi:hypothetical protein
MRRLDAHMSALKSYLGDAFHRGHAGRQRVRFRTLAFNSAFHPFDFGRSSICSCAASRYLSAADLKIDASSSLASTQSLPGTSARLSLCGVRKLFFLLVGACAHILASASAGIAEYFRRLLDPVVSQSSADIEIEGIGGRLVRDGHVVPATHISISTSSSRHSITLL